MTEANETIRYEENSAFHDVETAQETAKFDIEVCPSDKDPSFSSTNWFKNHYTPSVPLHLLLEIAAKVRGSSHTCQLGERWVGGFNVALTVRFDDGAEWIVKTPKEVDETTAGRLESEVATLKFLQKTGSSLIPRVYSYSVTADNPMRTPFIIMQKLPGVTLNRALSRGLDRHGVHRTLEGLAQFGKVLQQHPFRQIGSLYLDSYTDAYREDFDSNYEHEPSDHIIAELINLWSSEVPLSRYRGSFWGNPEGYYFEQHTLSLLSESIHDEGESKHTKRTAHFYLALLLPCYIQEVRKFYLAHTDLSISNLLVHPSDGTLLGIIDWEFANTLPPQSVEHYPIFLADRSCFLERFEDFLEDANSEFDNWRAHYAKQFLDDPETSSFNARIDAISAFESLLRHPNERPIHKIIETMKALKAANALNAPLPSFSWLDDLIVEPPMPTNGHINGQDRQLLPSINNTEPTLPITNDADHNAPETPSPNLVQRQNRTPSSDPSNLVLSDNPLNSIAEQSLNLSRLSPSLHSSNTNNSTSNELIIQMDSTTQTDISFGQIDSLIEAKGLSSIKGEDITNEVYDKEIDAQISASSTMGIPNTKDERRNELQKFKVRKLGWCFPSLDGCRKIYRSLPRVRQGRKNTTK
jgi:aminoglycoside phosphotransferase (APT) family kinase protein